MATSEVYQIKQVYFNPIPTTFYHQLYLIEHHVTKPRLATEQHKTLGSLLGLEFCPTSESWFWHSLKFCSLVLNCAWVDRRLQFLRPVQVKPKLRGEKLAQSFVLQQTIYLHNSIVFLFVKENQPQLRKKTGSKFCKSASMPPFAFDRPL